MDERFWAKVEKTDGCWLWRGNLSPAGYGQTYSPATRQTALAHRITYQALVGPIPEGLVLDHLCRTPACCNPAHLEPVTGEENFRRSPIWVGNKTHCPQGHPYAGANLRHKPDGGRRCRECYRQRAEAARRERGVRPRERPTHCLRGHALTAENVYGKPDGRRECRTCALARVARARAQRREGAA